jgi:hypothetical protein
MLRDDEELWDLAKCQKVEVGIGGIGNGRGFSAYCLEEVGEVGNFTDFLPTRFISTVTITGNRSVIG